MKEDNSWRIPISIGIYFLCICLGLAACEWSHKQGRVKVNDNVIINVK